MNNAELYIVTSLTQNVLFLITFVVLLRGFLGLYEDWKKSKVTKQKHFAWFTFGKKSELKTDKPTSSSQEVIDNISKDGKTE